jgi:hypothetical protein
LDVIQSSIRGFAFTGWGNDGEEYKMDEQSNVLPIVEIEETSHPYYW